MIYIYIYIVAVHAYMYSSTVVDNVCMSHAVCTFFE